MVGREKNTNQQKANYAHCLCLWGTAATRWSPGQLNPNLPAAATPASWRQLPEVGVGGGGSYSTELRFRIQHKPQFKSQLGP